jgi:hypothetical protein
MQDILMMEAADTCLQTTGITFQWTIVFDTGIQKIKYWSEDEAPDLKTKTDRAIAHFTGQ